MLSVLILADKGGVWENRIEVPRDLPLTKVAPPPPLAMPIIMGSMAADFLLYQVIRWGLEVALAGAEESVEDDHADGANGEHAAAGAKRAPAAVVVGVAVEEEEDAVNFYVLYIYIYVNTNGSIRGYYIRVEGTGQFSVIRYGTQCHQH